MVEVAAGPTNSTSHEKVRRGGGGGKAGVAGCSLEWSELP